jgi:hypothetical protein
MRAYVIGFQEVDRTGIGVDRSMATSPMTHIAIQEHVNGKVVDWMEQVSDEQYRATADASGSDTQAALPYEPTFSAALEPVASDVLLIAPWSRYRLAAACLELVTLECSV